MALTFGVGNRSISFAPTSAFPLNANSYFEDYNLALAAAQSAKEAGDSTTKYYFGQEIAVVDLTSDVKSAQLYIITPVEGDDGTLTGTLSEIGGKIEIDESQFAFVDGKLSILGFATAVEGAQLVKKDGKLAWVKADNTTVEGLSTSIATLEDTVFGTPQGDETRAEDGLIHRVGTLEAASAEHATKTELADGLAEKVDAATYATDKEAFEARDKELQDAIDAIEIPEVPVNGVADGDKVLSVTDKKIAATITLTYDEANSSIKLVGKDGADLGSVDASDFLVDGMLDDVSYDATNNTLTFTWNTAAGSKTDTVQLRDIIDPYTAANGITIDGTAIGLKLDGTSEGFLTLGADGLKLSGVQDAIDAAKEAAIADAEGKVSTLKTSVDKNTEDITALGSRTDTNEASIEGIEETISTLSGDVTALKEAGYITEAALTDYAKSADVATDISEAIEAHNADKTHLTADDVDGQIDAKLADYDTAEVSEGKIATAKQEAIDAAAEARVVKSVDETTGLDLSETGALSINEIPQAKVTGLADALAALTQKDTEQDTAIDSNTTAITNLTSRLDGIVAGGGEPNTINSITANGVTLAITDKVVDIPAATTSRFGLVQLGDEFQTNTDTGALEVKELNVNKLVQTAEDTLILDGGSADDLVV